jgi:hypothetical protein
MENEDELQSSVILQQVDGDPQVVFRPLDDTYKSIIESQPSIVGVILEDRNVKAHVIYIARPEKPAIASAFGQQFDREISVETKDSSSTHLIAIMDNLAIANQGVAESQLDLSIKTEIDGIIDNLAIANQRIAESQLEIDQLEIETREMLATLKSSLS